MPTWPLLPNAKYSAPPLQLGESLPSRLSFARHHMGCLYWYLGPAYHPADHVVGRCVIAWAP